MDVAVNGGSAYLACASQGMRIVNVTNPAAPTARGAYTDLNSMGLALNGSTVCLVGQQSSTNYHAALHTINVTNPDSPTRRGAADFGYTGVSLHVANDGGGFAYVTGSTATGVGLTVVNVGNPSTPSRVGSYDTPGSSAWGVFGLGGFAYVANGSEGGLQIISVGNPNQPVLDRFYDTPGSATGVTVKYGLTYVADGWLGLLVLDASVPGTTPTVIGRYDTAGSARAVQVSEDGLFYVADGYGGIVILKMRDYTAPEVTITTPVFGPTYTTPNAFTDIGGGAYDDVGVTEVTWANDRGGSGVASGTDSWYVPVVSLEPGVNVITVTARDEAGNFGNDVITVTYTDSQSPSVEIQSPTNLPTHTTSVETINIAGIASDNTGVTQVTWSNDRGGNGIATGTQNWSATADIILQLGPNIITVTARDQAGNVGIDILTVTYSPPDTDGDGVPDPNDSCPNTVTGAVVGTDGCPEFVPGDSDRDGDVDQLDFAAFQACASGPALPYSANCSVWDFDHDNDVDQSDFGIFQRCVSGENNPADPNCAN